MPPPPPPPAVANASVTVRTNNGAAFDVAMSTSFQPAEWDYQFFQNFPSATTPLANLQPNHIRLQGISRGVPQGSEGTSSQAWDFAILDAITQPLLRIWAVAGERPYVLRTDHQQHVGRHLVHFRQEHTVEPQA